MVLVIIGHKAHTVNKCAGMKPITKKGPLSHTCAQPCYFRTMHEKNARYQVDVLQHRGQGGTDQTPAPCWQF